MRSIGDGEAGADVSVTFDVLTCMARPPRVRIEPSDLVLEARASTGTRVLVDNLDENCVPTVWAFDYTNIPRRMHINLLPSTVQLASGQNGSAVLLFTAPTIDVVPFLTSNNTVWDMQDQARRASAPVSLTTHDVPCELATPDVRMSCEAFIDPTVQDSFECHMRIDNRDSWPCIRRSFTIEGPANWPIEAPFSWPRNAIEWSETVANVAIDDSDWLTMTVRLPQPFIDLVSNLTAEHGGYSRLGWTPMINITSAAEPSGQLYVGSRVRFGTCMREPPLLAVGVAPGAVLHVPLMGSGVVEFIVGNVNGAYCAANEHFDLRLDPPSLLHSLHGGVGGVTVKRGHNATLAWRFQAAEAGLFNVTLSAVVHDNDTIAAPPAQFFVNVSAACTVAEPSVSVLGNANITVLPGGARSANFTLRIESRDVGGDACEPASYRFAPDFGALPNPNYYYYHSPPYARAWGFDSPHVEVPPNGTVDVPVRFNIDSATAAQRFELRVEANSAHSLHRGDVGVSINMTCPKPAAVRNVTVRQYTPRFKLGRSVELQWNNPCPNEFLCCCPCEFHVMRNGSRIGVVTTRFSNHTFNFTDTEVVSNERFAYSIFVVDRHQHSSAEIDTCTHHIDVFVGAADLYTFIVFFSTVLVCALINIGLSYVAFLALRKRRQRKYDEKFGTEAQRDSLANRNDGAFGRINAAKLSTRRNERVALLAWKQDPLLSPEEQLSAREHRSAASPARPVLPPAPPPKPAQPSKPALETDLLSGDDPLRRSLRESIDVDEPPLVELP